MGPGNFIQIFLGVVLPVFVLVGVGFLADRLFKLDLHTLNKLNLYVLLAALLFVITLEADILGLPGVSSSAGLR